MDSHQMELKIPNVDNYTFVPIHSDMLSSLPITKKLRLGQRVEHLFQHYLGLESRYELKANNIQVYKDKLTLGELDYILYDKVGDTYIHLELACKFYCFDPSISDIEDDCWIGPNRRDSFLEKCTKLQGKQMPLLANPETQKALQLLGVPTVKINQQICFFAQLFIPFDTPIASFKSQYPSCIKGRYISIRQLIDYNDSNTQFYIPEKQDWLIHPSNNIHWTTKQNILPSIQAACDTEHSVFLWVKQDTTYQKWFVVWW